jgi:hypothetical protein
VRTLGTMVQMQDSHLPARAEAIEHRS